MPVQRGEMPCGFVHDLRCDSRIAPRDERVDRRRAVDPASSTSCPLLDSRIDSAMIRAAGPRRGAPTNLLPATVQHDSGATHDLVQALVEGLRLQTLPAGAAFDGASLQALRTLIAILLAGAYLATFSGRADLSSAQERSLQRLLENPSGGELTAVAVEHETARGFEFLAEFTQPSFGRPPAHSAAVSRVAAMFEVLGLAPPDASRSAGDVAQLVNEHIFKRFWRR